MASSSVEDGEQSNKRLSGTSDYCNSKNGDIPIRLVCVGVEKRRTKMTIDEIESFFGRYGEIESVVIRSGATRTSCMNPLLANYVVQFKQEENAKEAIYDTKANWYGFEVNAADPCNQPDHPLQVPPEQDSESNILNALNDDCLQEIFKLLKVTDLTNVAGVCKRFNEQAKITFDFKHKRLNMNQFYYDYNLYKIATQHFG